MNFPDGIKAETVKASLFLLIRGQIPTAALRADKDLQRNTLGFYNWHMPPSSYVYGDSYFVFYGL